MIPALWTLALLLSDVPFVPALLLALNAAAMHSTVFQPAPLVAVTEFTPRPAQGWEIGN